MSIQLFAWLGTCGQGILSLPGCLLVSTLILSGLYVYRKYSEEPPFSWTKCGVPQAETGIPLFLDFKKEVKRMIEEHGTTVGFVLNPTKNLVTTDVDLIRNIMIKDFSSFPNRNETFLSNSQLMKSVFFSLDHVWKRKRQILSPNFTTTKLKVIAKIMNEKCKRLGNVMAENAKDNQLVSVRELAGRLTAEVIAQAAFGCQINSIDNGDKDEFTHNCKRMFKNRSKLERRIIGLIFKSHWCRLFVIKVLKLSFFDFIDMKVTDYFASMVKQVVAARQQAMREGRTVPTDLLQLMLNTSDLIADGNLESSNEGTLSMNDIIGESMLVILAGYDTSAAALQFIFYYLAVHQDVQEKVFQEIQRTVRGAEPTYDEIAQLTYTRQVIDETLRLQPPAPLTERTACRDVTYGSITIPSQTKVIIPMFLIHRDPKFYTNPDDFDPDRFSAEAQSQRDPSSFLPFGVGPRQCLGIRMAYNEIKYALVHVLTRVQFMVNEHTTPPAGKSFTLKANGTTTDTTEPILLAVRPREM